MAVGFQTERNVSGAISAGLSRSFVGTLAQRTLRMSSRNVRLIGVTPYRRSLGDVTS